MRSRSEEVIVSSKQPYLQVMEGESTHRFVFCDNGGATDGLSQLVYWYSHQHEGSSVTYKFNYNRIVVNLIPVSYIFHIQINIVHYAYCPVLLPASSIPVVFRLRFKPQIVSTSLKELVSLL